MKIVSTIIAIGFGLAILVAYFLQPLFPVLRTPLQYLLEWAIILAAIASLIGVFNLLSVHWNKLRQRKAGFIYSLVVLIGFFVTLVIGILFNSAYFQWITQIQFAAETTLIALLSITLALAGIRLLQKKLNLLTITFVISALVFFVLNIGYLTAGNSPIINNIALAVNRLPVAGSRGILIGVALGSLTMGLRILLGVDRPYGG
jgi:signal transduction histidine kinase